MQKIMFNDRYGLTDAVLRGSKTMTRRTEFKHDEQAELINLSASGFTPIVEDNKVVVRSSDSVVLFRKKTRYEVGEVVAVAQSYNEVDSLYAAAFHRRHSIHGMTVTELDCISDKDIRNWLQVRETYLETKSWNNKMFVKAERMPHHIRITGIRVQRLQDISDEDCLKEGIFEDSGDNAFPPPIFYDYQNNRGNGFDTPRSAYAALIDRVSGKGTWDSNPFVVAYEFELID